MENNLAINDVISIFFVLFGLYEFVIGILGMVKGRIFNNARYLSERYTEESVKKYAKPYGFATALLGLCFIVLETAYTLPRFVPSVNRTVFYIIGGVMFAAALIIMIVSNKILEKK